MVYAHNLSSWRIGHGLVPLGHIHRHLRVSASRIILAASAAAALYRLPEVLLGKWNIKPPFGRHHSVSASTHDMATTHVDKEEDNFDWRLRPRRFVSFISEFGLHTI